MIGRVIELPTLLDPSKLRYVDDTNAMVGEAVKLERLVGGLVKEGGFLIPGHLVIKADSLFFSIRQMAEDFNRLDKFPCSTCTNDDPEKSVVIGCCGPTNATTFYGAGQDGYSPMVGAVLSYFISMYAGEDTEIKWNPALTVSRSKEILEHSACVFWSSEGCILPWETRPVSCLDFICPDLYDVLKSNRHLLKSAYLQRALTEIDGVNVYKNTVGGELSYVRREVYDAVIELLGEV